MLQLNFLSLLLRSVDRVILDVFLLVKVSISCLFVVFFLVVVKLLFFIDVGSWDVGRVKVLELRGFSMLLVILFLVFVVILAIFSVVFIIILVLIICLLFLLLIR